MPPAVAFIGFGVAYATVIAHYWLLVRGGRRGEEMSGGVRWAMIGACVLADAAGLAAWGGWAMTKGAFVAAGLTLAGIFVAAVPAVGIAPQVATGFADWIAYLLMGEREASLPEMPQMDSALAAMKKRDWAAAEARLRELLAERPDHHDARAELAQALEKQGRTAEAAGELQRAGMDASEPDAAAGRVFRAAEWWVRAGRRDLARFALERLVEKVSGTKHEKYARDRLAAL